MTRVLELNPGETELEQVWNKRPEYFAIFMGDYEKSLAGADPVHVELTDCASPRWSRASSISA